MLAQQRALPQQATIFSRGELSCRDPHAGSDPMRFDRIRGEAILILGRKLPQTLPSVQKTSTWDLPQKKKGTDLNLIRVPIHQLSHSGKWIFGTKIVQVLVGSSHATVWVRLIWQNQWKGEEHPNLFWDITIPILTSSMRRSRIP